MDWNFTLRFFSLLQDLGQRFGRPAGRIFFHLVMRFDNRDVKIAAELLDGFSRQPEKHIDSDAEIGCEYDRQRLRGLFDRAALLCRVTGRPNDQRLAMLQRNSTDFSDGAGVTEIDRYLAVSHGWLNQITQITLLDDIDFWVVLRKITNGFSHAASCTDEQYVHGRRSHLRRILTFSCHLEKGEAIACYPLKRFCPPLPLRKE